MRAESAAGARDLAQGAKLGLGLDVEAENPGVERESHFGPRLADTREDDLFRRNASRQRAMDLALRDHVSAGAEPRQRANDRDIGIRLDRVANERVAPGKGLRKHVVMALDGRRRIAIEWRADLARNCVKSNIFGMKMPFR